VSLLHELDSFYLEHRRCGELDAGVDGPVVWFGCGCGARDQEHGGVDDARAVPRSCLADN